MTAPILPTSLYDLRHHFNQNGFDLRLVGGFVRDHIMGIKAKDIDICTDATPDQQRRIYETYGVRHIDTGLQHGTWTVILDKHTFEITSLRVDTACDGRHAEVSYTHDWILDLSRRDLTINAIQMKFDGTIVDPFNGQEDIKSGTVRFVGNAEKRIQEDYLRILRWFRFHARMGKGKFTTNDILTHDAIKNNMSGLQNISRERIWAEFSRIISDENGLVEILSMINMGLAPFIDLPLLKFNNNVSFNKLESARRFTKDPISLLASYLGSKAEMNKIADAWKFSNNEREQGLAIIDFAAPWRNVDLLQEAKKRVSINNVPKKWIIEALLVKGNFDLACQLNRWEKPTFPVSGNDLIAIGITPGKIMGRLLNILRQIWQISDYTKTKDDLLRLIGANS